MARDDDIVEYLASIDGNLSNLPAAIPSEVELEPLIGHLERITELLEQIRDRLGK